MNINFRFNKAKRKCKVCGKEFIPTCPRKIYCSEKCADKVKAETNGQSYLKVKKDKKGRIK